MARQQLVFSPMVPRAPSGGPPKTLFFSLFAISVAAAFLGCNPGFGQAPDASSVPARPSDSKAASSGAPTPTGTFNSGIDGAIRGGGGAAPGTSFHPVGSCASIFDSAGTLIAKGYCDQTGEFKVALPPGTYTVQAAGQKLRVEVRMGSWTKAYFRINMR